METLTNALHAPIVSSGKLLTGTMKIMKRAKQRFTLIEMLAVIAIVSILIAILAPAFNRMLFGNKVDQCAANLKLGFDLAQARAISSRKYVAMVMPTDRDIINDRKLRNFCNGGFRLAYVKNTGTATAPSWTFDSWVEGLSWRNECDGAMVVKVVRETLNPRPEDLQQSAKNPILNKLEFDKDVNVENVYSMLDVISSASGTSNADVVGANADWKELDKNNGVTASSNNRRGVVFSPYGGLAGHYQNFNFVITEAGYSNNAYKITNVDNFLVLTLHAITGRASYYNVDELRGDD